MKYYRKLIISITFIFLFLFFQAIKISVAAQGEKLNIPGFEKINDIYLCPDSMGEFSGADNAEEYLYSLYPTVTVLGTSDTIDADTWSLLDKTHNEKNNFNNCVEGTYIFSSILSFSDKYNINDCTYTPTIKIIISAEPHAEKTLIINCESFKNIYIETNDFNGYENESEAKKTLLKKYNTVKVNDSDDTVDISSWVLADDEFDPSVCKEYIFYGKLLDSDKYYYDDNTVFPSIKIIVTEPKIEKEVITSFASLSNITVKTTNNQVYLTESEAADSLLYLYKNVEVNGSKDTVPIIKWKRNNISAAFDVTKDSTYIFTAVLGTSEKYDTENLAVALPTVKIVFTVPVGVVSVFVNDKNYLPVNGAAIMLRNDENYYYGTTDANGECTIQNVECGTYKLILYANDLSYNKTITVNDNALTSFSFIAVSTKTTTSSTTFTTTTSISKTKVTTSENTDTDSIYDYDKIKEQLISNSSVELASSKTDSGFIFKITTADLSEEQINKIKNMSSTEIEAEIKKITAAVSTLNFTQVTDESLKKLSEVGKGIKAIPINFSKHAAFAFPVNISVLISKDTCSVRDDYYFYYYNEETKMLEDCGNASLDDNGILEFTISHCSDYFITDKEIMIENNDFEVTDEKYSDTEIINEKNSSMVTQTSIKELVEQADLSEEPAQAPTKIIVINKNNDSISIKIIAGMMLFMLFIIVAVRSKTKK